MEERKQINEEKIIRGKPGIPMLILGIILLPAALFGLILGIQMTAWGAGRFQTVLGVVLAVISGIYLCLCWVPFAGLKVIRPNEALVLTLFGKYYGTLREPGIFFVNPFVAAVNPTIEGGEAEAGVAGDLSSMKFSFGGAKKKDSAGGKKVSLKALTLNNGKQKINDQLGNPIEIGIVVIWRVQIPQKLYLMWTITWNFCPFRRIPPCGTLCGCTLTISRILRKTNVPSAAAVRKLPLN